MTRRVVCDASAMIAMLIDSGADGLWATTELSDAEISAPILMSFEAANVIRRSELAGVIGSDQAAQAHADLLDLPVDSWPYELLASRAWELRHTVTVYDGAYVALAEALGAPLVTLDEGIRRAPGPRCLIRTPSATQER